MHLKCLLGFKDACSVSKVSKNESIIIIQFVYWKTPLGVFIVMKSAKVYLESQVLQEEACSIVLLTLVAAASTDPQSNL